MPDRQCRGIAIISEGKLLVAARELNLNPADIGDSRPFSDLILSAAENRKQIVILIDGYDVPVFRNLGNPEVEEIQKSLILMEKKIDNFFTQKTH